MDIERFLAGVESRASQLTEDRRRTILERLELARAFLGSHDPLDFFLTWRTPDELYRPTFPGADEVRKDGGDG